MFYYYLKGYPASFSIMTFSIDQRYPGIRLFYGKVYVLIKVYDINIFFYIWYAKTYFHLSVAFVYSIFCFFSIMEIQNLFQYRRKYKVFFFFFSLECGSTSVIAHNSAKMTFLEAYNAVFRYDFVCFSETFPIFGTQKS